MLTRITILACALFASACATSARYLPSATEWRTSASRALKDPDTWIPAALAIAVVATDSDREISDWAADETPIFQSNESAGDWSDRTKLGVHLLMIGTAIAPREEPSPVRDRLLTVVENEVVTLPSLLATGAIKEASNRERPDESSFTSFPSGHASVSSSYAAVTERNLEDMRASRNVKRATRIAARVLVATTAWARIEARKHYPTDVLAGMALGNLLTSFVDRAFRPDGTGGFRVGVDASRDGYMLVVTMHFGSE